MAKIVADNRGAVFKAVQSLLKSRCVVGIPGDARHPTDDGKGTVSTALIGYVQEYGDPAKNIPARPFLVPGIESVRGQITAQLVQGARAAVGGDTGAAERTFRAVGLLAQDAVKTKLMNGDFAPLSDRTIEARARRRNQDSGKLSMTATSKNARLEIKRRKAGQTPSADLAKPLYDKGDLFRAIQFIVRLK